MRDQQIEERLQHRTTRPHLVGQGGEAERHAFAGIALGLSVERLVLTKLLEHQHRQEARPRPAAGDDVEGGRHLTDLLAITAGEFFTDVLDHLPTARDRLQRLGDGLAQLGQARAAAAGAGCRAWHNDTLTRQMVWEGFAGRPVTGERGNSAGFGRRSLGCQLIFGSTGFQLFKLECHLVEQAGAAFRTWAEFIAL